MAGITRRARSVIKSIQRGNTTIPVENTVTNVTITAVDMDKSVVILGGSVYKADNSSNYEGGVNAYLTSTTNLRIDHDGSGTNLDNYDIAWEVLEYE